MNEATSAEFDAGRASRTTSRDARRWIERQLRWERTLDVLRDRRPEPARRAA